MGIDWPIKEIECLSVSCRNLEENRCREKILPTSVVSSRRIRQLPTLTSVTN